MSLTTKDTHINEQEQIVANKYIPIRQGFLNDSDFKIKKGMYEDKPIDDVKEDILQSVDYWFSIPATVCTIGRSCADMKNFKLTRGDLNSLLNEQYEFMKNAGTVDEIKGFYVTFNSGKCNIWINVDSEDLKIEDEIYKIFYKFETNSFDIMLFRDYEIKDVENIGYSISLKRVGEN